MRDFLKGSIFALPSLQIPAVSSVLSIQLAQLFAEVTYPPLSLTVAERLPKAPGPLPAAGRSSRASAALTWPAGARIYSSKSYFFTPHY